MTLATQRGNAQVRHCVNGMAILIIVAANAFSLVIRVLDGDVALARMLYSLGLGNWGKLQWRRRCLRRKPAEPSE